jgi:2-oxoglutarate ferredoxin oxidoreductase subunit alpha
MDKKIISLDEVTIRFAGDSGDGMQLTGTQFSDTTAAFGQEVNTFPDYPSEIRAPEGTLYGVSAYQVHFGVRNINTPGDRIDVLVAMNASSLKVNLKNIKRGGIIIANRAGFVDKQLKLAKYDSNPLEDGSLSEYNLVDIDITAKVQELLKDTPLSHKHIARTKNIFALGFTYWLYSLPLAQTEKWLVKKFGKKPDILEANKLVLKAGWEFGENSENIKYRYEIKKANLEPGFYRNITGNEAAALGLITASQKANLPLFLGSYPITPATEILHHLSGHKSYGVMHLQAEDEIAGICSAIGAAYGGSLSATSTSGPGLSLKVEALGLAVILEIPLVIVDVQRAGPSTGVPTKTEQSDLFLAVFGRHGEAPIPVIAAQSASDCFDMAFEAARLALKYMTPVLLLTDGYLGQSSEPWRVPDVEKLPDISPTFYTDKDYQPYKRDPETLARLWAIPGTPGLEHRIGGLEKENLTGNVSSDAKNHQLMCEFRRDKIEGIVREIPPCQVLGEQEGDLLVITWGSTFGAMKTAFEHLIEEGKKLSFLHLKYLNPLPSDLGDVLKKFKRVLVPEVNLGQLAYILRSKYLIEIEQFNIIQGNTFKSYEIEEKINQMLENKEGK